jgi:hypothetical protein
MGETGGRGVEYVTTRAWQDDAGLSRDDDAQMAPSQL